MMGEKRELRDSMSIEEAIVSKMCEIAAIVEVLERNGPLLGLYPAIQLRVRRRVHARAANPNPRSPRLAGSGTEEVAFATMLSNW